MKDKSAALFGSLLSRVVQENGLSVFMWFESRPCFLMTCVKVVSLKQARTMPVASEVLTVMLMTGLCLRLSDYAVWERRFSLR